jgi:nucleoside-diphosphate-sugar epimerase
MGKVVVTGAGGYIGTQLVRDLVLGGNEVLAVDRFFFGQEPLMEFKNDKNVKILKKDIRDLDEVDLKNYDAVCDLACLSNDPAGEIDPNLTFQINRDGRIHVARMAKKAGIKKYILSSSCSVYGQGEEAQLSENSATNPISVYAKSTLEAEQENLSLNDNNFSVTALRNATVFGLSTRMRFDLVVNLMTLTAFQKNRIIVMGGGLQWRPLVHVSDVSKAFIAVINAETKKVAGEVFNIGFDNFQIKNLAYLVREQLPMPIDIDLAPDDADKRDYNVLFEKASKQIGFKATTTVQWYRNILEAQKLLEQVTLNGRVI